MDPVESASEAASSPDVGEIRTALERRAMDWTLVLVSQGIPVSLDHANGTGWILTVPSADLDRARRAIGQFRRENRGFGWRRELPGSGRLFHRGVLLWVTAVAFLFSFQGYLGGGLFDSRQVRAGEWWRAFTAEWLHADLGHLASNAVIGTVVLGLAMARHGAGWALLLAGLAGAAANGIGLMFRPGAYVGLGASGMVMAGLGLLVPQAMPWWRAGRRETRLALGSIGAGAFLFLLLGTDPAGDVLVHAAGFLFGLIGGVVLALVPDAFRLRSDWGAALVFVAVHLAAWICVLRT